MEEMYTAVAYAEPKISSLGQNSPFSSSYNKVYAGLAHHSSLNTEAIKLLLVALARFRSVVGDKDHMLSW